MKCLQLEILSNLGKDNTVAPEDLLLSVSLPCLIFLRHLSLHDAVNKNIYMALAGVA